MADALADALRVVLNTDAKTLKRIDAVPSTSSARAHRDVVESLATLRARARDAKTIDSALDPILARIVGNKSAKYALICMCQGDASSARAIGDALNARLKTKDDAKRALSACVGIDAITSEDVDVRAVFDLRETLRALGDVARAHESGKPTRLGAAACEAFTSLGARAALSSNDDDSGLELLECVPAFVRVIALIESWAPESAGCGLFRESCERARERLNATTTSTNRHDVAEDGYSGDKDAQRRILAKSLLVKRIWSDWSPALMPIKSTKDEKRMLAALKGAFGAARDMVNSDDENAANGVAHALITVGLNLGRLGIDHGNREVFASMVSEETARGLDEMLQENVAVVLLPALRCSNAIAQSIAAVLIRVVLAPEHLGWTEQSESLLHGVLPLVEEDEKVISTGFARLVADLTARNPQDDALMNILQLCGGSARSAKISALNVLSEILRLDRTMSDDSLAAVMRTILPRLSDKDMESRRAAAAVLAHVPPHTMLPTLIRLLVSKDAEERAAAGDSILSMLREQRSPARSMEMYFSALEAMSRAENTVADAERAKTNADAISRAAKLLTRFAETVSSDDWPEIAQIITRAVFATPAATVLHQSMITLMPWIGSLPARSRVFECCAAAFTSQSDDKSDGGDEEGSMDIFTRLAPVLVLRALPLDAFDDQSSVKNIQAHVIRRMLNIQGEYEDVRRVASEVFGRMPSDIVERELFPALHAAYAGAKTSRHDLARVRTCMFSCNCALVSRGISAFSGARRDELREIAADSLTWPAASADDVDVTKLHMGAMETLASLIVAEIESSNERGDDGDVSVLTPRSSSALLGTEPSAASLRLNDAPVATSGRALIVEISDDEHNNTAIKTSKTSRATAHVMFPTLRGVLGIACGAFDSDDDVPSWIKAERRRNVSLRLAMMNVIIATARRPQSAHTRILVNACMPQLVTCAEHRGEPEIRAAALQALMMVFHAAERDDAADRAAPLVQTITTILRDHACGDVVRMGATRVATALLAGEEPVLHAIEPHLEALRQALDVAARVAVDAEVSSLAAKLASCMTA